MRINVERRVALVDAAIEVLATSGARGLTYRAVDTAAGVPVGTASNYFPRRDDLLDQAAQRILERLRPAPQELAEAALVAPSRDRMAEVLIDAVERSLAQPSVYLALLELRLEATRRPSIAAALTAVMHDNLEVNERFQTEAGLPGDELAVTGLYLALTGLVIDRLTLPDALPGLEPAEFVRDLVRRLVPDADGQPD